MSGLEAADAPIHVDLKGGPVEIVGALDLTRTPTGLIPRRLPAWTRHQLPDIAMDMLVQTPASVRLRFRTDADRFDLDVQLIHFCTIPDEVRAAVFEVVVDGEIAGSASTTAGHQIVLEGPDPGDARFVKGEPATLHFERLGGKSKVVELWLAHRAVVELRSLRVPAGTTVTPAPGDVSPRWVHYGSSISHCMEVARPTQTWPAVAAFDAGVRLQNLAFAGNCMLDPFVARTIRDLPADVISAKIGINVVNGDTMRERTFGPTVHGFLDTIREGHPRTPILIVSPIWCPSVENHPGPNVAAPDGRYIAVDGLEEQRTTCLTLQKVRSTLAALVEARRALGDVHVHLLDGLELFGADDAPDLPDDLHPNPAGYLRMGHRFAAKAFGEGGPLHAAAAFDDP